MPLQNDLSIASDKFRKDAISDKTAKFNEQLSEMQVKANVNWWKVSLGGLFP